MPEALTAAAQCLLTAERLCISTGAGMSVESGLDTFRGEDGLWSKVRIEEMATPEAFERDPLKVWAWYRWRRQKLATVAPHAGHRVLAAWEDRVAACTIVTQNIDGLHHRAGSRNVLELHGRLDEVRCTRCNYETRTLDDLGADPRCPECRAQLRPGVVWFGELLPQGVLEAGFEAAAACDVFVVIGTSGVVQPAASLADVAKSRCATIIEINPNPSEVSLLADVQIRAGSRAALVAIDELWLRYGQ